MSKQLREILENLVDPNDDSLQYDPPELLSRAEAQIKKYIENIIGSDEKQEWDDEFSMCNHCDYQPQDTRDCLCVIRNQLRQEQKERLK